MLLLAGTNAIRFIDDSDDKVTYDIINNVEYDDDKTGDEVMAELGFSKGVTNSNAGFALAQ